MRLSYGAKDLLLWLLLLAIVALFWLPHAVEVSAVLIVLLFAFSVKSRIRTAFEQKLLYLFFLAIGASIVLGVYHFNLIEENINAYGKTLGKILVLAGGVVIIDAVSTLFKHYKIDPVKFAQLGIVAVFISVLLKVIFVYVSQSDQAFLNIFHMPKDQSFLSDTLNA
ncbi:MAG: hypothetical protein AB8B49_03780, partial [Nitratireductor sp.]